VALPARWQQLDSDTACSGGPSCVTNFRPSQIRLRGTGTTSADNSPRSCQICQPDRGPGGPRLALVLEVRSSLGLLTSPSTASLRYSQRVAKDYLLLISDREPLAWVLTEGRMAFPAGRVRLASQIAEGDRLFLYTTRGCFRNPTRDRGRVIGEATVTSPVVVLDEPVVFGDRSFGLGCSLSLTGLAPRDSGPELRPLVERMHIFPDPMTWSVRLRWALIPLDRHDAGLLHRELAPSMRPADTQMDSYLRLTTLDVAR
jgi:hypothetical protein